MLFANVLEMSIDKYLNYVDRFINITSKAPFYEIHHIDDRISNNMAKGTTGAVVREKGDFQFYSSEYIKMDFELLEEPSDIKWKHSMNWIKTKNRFIHHIVANLLELQRDFFETHERKTMIPISLKEFLEECQLPFLDISRLSRLVNNTFISFNNSKYLLKELLWNKRKVYTSYVEHVISSVSIYRDRIKDNEIQDILKRNYGIDLSVRTICNYRNSVHIPAYNKINSNNPYSKFFSRDLPLHKKCLNLVPEKAGVYEISVIKHIKYPKFASGVIYYGRSKNLLSRIRSYLYANIKNSIIEHYRKSQESFVRYFPTSEYVQVEKELLKRFLDQFGSLPIANKLPNKI